MNDTPPILDIAQKTGLHECARIVGLALIVALMKFLARKDAPTDQSLRFSNSPARRRLNITIAFLRLPLLLAMMFLTPRMQMNSPEVPVELSATVAFGCAALLIAIGIAVWPLDRSMARGSILSVLAICGGGVLIGYLDNPV